jgi:gluconokinase
MIVAGLAMSVSFNAPSPALLRLADLCSDVMTDRFLADMAQAYPTIISGLRSPLDQVNGIVYFGRMLDKMRLAAAVKLPAAWEAARGTKHKTSFDSRCCRFLQIDYAALEAETLKGEKSDAELLEWAFQHGRRPGEEEIEIWNAFMTKRGWRDAGTERLHERLAEIGLPPGTVQTMFEFIDLDEGRRSQPG